MRRAVTPMVWFVTSNASAVVQRFDSVHLLIKMYGIIRLYKSEDGCSNYLTHLESMSWDLTTNCARSLRFAAALSCRTTCAK